MNALRKWIVLPLALFIVVLPAQAHEEVTPEEIEQAAEVVHQWLNMPDAPLRYFHSEVGSIGLSGPRRSVTFEAPYRWVTVDLLSMRVGRWLHYFHHWVKEARTDLPEKTEDEIRSIAWNYVQQHFAPLSEFPHWDVRLERTLESDLFFNTGKKAAVYDVDFSPYVFSAAGQRIPVLTTSCRVSVDPYTGQVLGFGFSHMPFTLTHLEPTLSLAQAKVAIEAAFRQLGATDAYAVMHSEEEANFEWTPDGLVVGANQTSGLRLAYLFDYVATYAEGERADEFGSLEEPFLWYAGIDAHTGELLYRDVYLGEATDEAKRHLLARVRSYHIGRPAVSASSHQMTTVSVRAGQIVVNGAVVSLRHKPILRSGRVYVRAKDVSDMLAEKALCITASDHRQPVRSLTYRGERYIALRDVCKVASIRLHWDNQRKVPVLYAEWLDVKKRLRGK